MRDGIGVQPGPGPGKGKRCPVVGVKAASLCRVRNVVVNERLFEKSDWDREQVSS